MKRKTILQLSSAALTLFTFLILPSCSFAVNGGEDVDPKKRAPHETTGATVWQDGPHLIEPCTAVLMCKNVILTVNHCINFAPAGESYFTLVNDINALPGKGSRYEKTVDEYKRKDQKTTARLDRESLNYGETVRTPFGIFTGLTMIKFKGTDALPDLPYLSLAKADFKLDQDLAAKVWDSDDASFLRPGAAASAGIIAGYGDAGPKRAGAGKLKKGVMRFMSWIEPVAFQPQGTTRPKFDDMKSFLIQFASQKPGNDHGCPGDSGGPVLVDTNRLAGNLDFITDQTCEGKDTRGGGGNFNTYVSLLYTKNRKFVADYMTANCGDNRTIDVKTGDNAVPVKPKDDDKDKEECTTVTPDNTYALSADEYVKFLAGWTIAMESGLPGLSPITAITDPLNPVEHANDPQVVCAKPTPVATPTTEPTSWPTVAPTVDPTVAPTVSPTQVPTAVPTSAPTANPTFVKTPLPAPAPIPVPDISTTKAGGLIIERF